MENKEYIVYRHTTPNGKVYYGVTSNIKSRWYPSNYKHTSLQPYIDMYGWKNINHEILYSGLNRDEALKIEDELIVNGWNNDTCINYLRSGHRTQTDEFKEEQKAQNKARSKVHYETHKEKYKAYREAHKEAHKAYLEVYNEAHRDEQKAHRKAYYEANKERINARTRERYKRKKAEKQAQQSNADNTKSTTPKQKHKKQLF